MKTSQITRPTMSNENPARMKPIRRSLFMVAGGGVRNILPQCSHWSSLHASDGNRTAAKPTKRILAQSMRFTSTMVFLVILQQPGQTISGSVFSSYIACGGLTCDSDIIPSERKGHARRSGKHEIELGRCPPSHALISPVGWSMASPERGE